VFIPTPIFFNPMIKQTKGYYGKYPKKKSRPFTERAGDWICSNCKNLNFAFRVVCNRCHLSKSESEKIIFVHFEKENLIFSNLYPNQHSLNKNDK
jgi:hypothetical protein